MNRTVLRSVSEIFLAVLVFIFPVAAQQEELKLEILNGHSGGGVLAVAVSADGKFALTGSDDKTALLWEIETGKQLRRFVGHEDAVSCVQFSHDGKYVMTASHDKTARLWETATGRPVALAANKNGIFAGHEGKILAAAVSDDGKYVATAGEDKTARIWDLASGRQLHRINHTGKVNSIAFSPDSKLFLTGGEDKIARLFSTATGNEEKRFVGHTEEILSIAFSSKNNEILSGSLDGTVRLWNIETALEQKSLNLRIENEEGYLLNSVNNAVFASDGAIIVSDWSSLSLYDESLQRRIWTARKTAMSVSLVPDKPLIFVAGSPAAFVDMKDGSTTMELRGKSGAITNIDVSSDYGSVLTGGSWWATVLNGDFSLTGSNVTGLWSLSLGRPLETFDERKKPVENRKGRIGDKFKFEEYVTFSPDERLVSIANGKGEIWDLEKRARIFVIDEFARNKDRILKMVFAPDSKTVVVSSLGELSIWNIEKRIKERTLIELNQDDDYRFGDIAISKSGNRIAFTTVVSNSIRIIEVASGRLERIFDDFPAPVHSVVFSPDGKNIATAAGGELDLTNVGIGAAAKANSIKVFDVETGRELESFGGDFKLISNKITGFISVAYSPDGKFIAAGAFDGKVVVRNNETKELRKFEGHTDVVNSVKFAKDANGRLLVVSGSADSTTRIWDVATGEELCALITFRDGNWAVVQTKTGRYDASNAGEIDGIQWVFGTETIALSQLKDIYYTPNLLPRLLGYNKEPLAEVRPLSKFKLFPEILSREFNKQTADLTVKLRNRGGGIGPVRILVNGSLASEDARTDELRKNPDRTEAVISLNLRQSAGYNPNGENRIEVITNDFDPEIKKSFVSSARSTTVVEIGDGQSELKKPTLYAIVGGVSDYNGTQLDLNFAARDAEAFANALNISARRLFCPADKPQCDDKVKVRLLTTSGEANLPTKPNFRRAFEEIAQNAKPEDILVVYLAGHGTSLNVGDAETYFYLTQESEIGSKDAVAKNPERSISNAEILDWLTQTQWRTDKKGIDAGNKVLILDTCAAGTFESALSKTKQRDLSADQIRALEKLKDRSGLQILMGSAANQSAYEASQYGQGLLTYALLEGIKGAALENERVETGKLFDYAVNRVPKMDISNGNSGLQSPRDFGSTSIPIGIIKNEDRPLIKFLESPLPVFARPFLFKKDENFDTLGLIDILAKTLDEAATPFKRGSGSNQTAPLVYIDEDNFPGAYRVTGTYTDENGRITVEAVLRKDGKVVATLTKVVGKDLEELTVNLREAVFRGISGPK